MLVTLNKVKEYLGIPLGDTTMDAWLTSQIVYVSEAIEIYCNRKFQQYRYKETIHVGLAKEWLSVGMFQLWQYPVKEIVSVSMGGREVPLIPHYDSGILKCMRLPVLDTTGKIEIEYIAGYATLPPLIESVIFSILQERYNKKKSGIDVNFGSDIQRLSIAGAMSIDYDYSLANNDVKSTMGVVLGNYRNMLSTYCSNRTIHGEGLHYVTIEPV